MHKSCRGGGDTAVQKQPGLLPWRFRPTLYLHRDSRYSLPTTPLRAPFMTIGLFTCSKGLNGRREFSGRYQRTDHMFDVGIEFVAAETGGLVLSLQLQKSQVDRVRQPCLVSGDGSVHPQFFKCCTQVSHAALGHSFKHRLYLWMTGRCAKLTVNFMRELLFTH